MISELANHLWQSTLFAVAIGLLTLMCRQNHASVRYWLWFSASVKFFVPFTLLVALGDRLEWTSSTVQQIAAPAVSATLAQVGRPFVADSALSVLAVPEAPRGTDWLALALLGVWVSGIIAMTVVRCRMWRQVRAAVRASTPWAAPGLPMPAGVDVRSAPGVMEPGVVGFWRPVLLVPSGIEDDLTPRQLAAVLTHEVCHVRRRDNVTAAVHMVAEAVFWFHPLVWWIGKRLVDERERACDEEVVRTFGEPQTYAEGIVNVCRRYVESPLTCVSGVGGANVKNRIRDIMTNRAVAKLSVAQKAVLAGVGAIAVVAPILTQARLAFDVASVRENTSGSEQGFLLPQGSQLNAQNYRLSSLIQSAYRVQPFELVGAPDWVLSARYDITARASFEPKPTPPGSGAAPGEMEQMLQTLLAERFSLRVHREQREMPVYALVLARRDGQPGPRLKREAAACAALRDAIKAGEKPLEVPTRADGRPACAMMGGGGRFFAGGVTVATLASALSAQAGRAVVDRTGLSGFFEADLEFSPDALTDAASERPSLFTALEEQLGLKLEPLTAPVEVLVIDHVERPTPN